MSAMTDLITGANIVIIGSALLALRETFANKVRRRREEIYGDSPRGRSTPNTALIALVSIGIIGIGLAVGIPALVSLLSGPN